MDLEERGYSVLVVSAAEKLNTALSSVLSEYGCAPVRFVSTVNAAERALCETAYDFLIINSPLPDDPGIRFAIDRADSKETVVLILLRGEFFDETFDRVSKRGVFALPKPVNRSSLSQALSWMESARELLRRFEEKTLSVEEKMEEIRVVNRAKWLLISELKMDEPQAHRYIEKQAMDKCISKKRVAEEIIRTYS